MNSLREHGEFSLKTTGHRYLDIHRKIDEDHPLFGAGVRSYTHVWDNFIRIGLELQETHKNEAIAEGISSHFRGDILDFLTKYDENGKKERKGISFLNCPFFTPRDMSFILRLVYFTKNIDDVKMKLSKYAEEEISRGRKITNSASSIHLILYNIRKIGFFTLDYRERKFEPDYWTEEWLLSKDINRLNERILKWAEKTFKISLSRETPLADLEKVMSRMVNTSRTNGQSDRSDLEGLKKYLRNVEPKNIGEIAKY